MIQSFVTKYLRKECDDLNEVASDNDDDKGDDDDAYSKDVEVAEISTGEPLTKLVNLKYLSQEERNSLVAMKDNLKKIRVLKNTQSHIINHFMLA